MGLEAFKQLTEIDSSEYLQGVDHKTHPIDAITQATADTVFPLIYPEISQVTCCKILKGHYLYCEFDTYRLIVSLNDKNTFFERLLTDLTGIDAIPPDVKWTVGKVSDVESEEDCVIEESFALFGSADNAFAAYTPKQCFTDAIEDDDGIPIKMETVIASRAKLVDGVEFDASAHEHLKTTLLTRYGDINAEILHVHNAFKNLCYITALRRLNCDNNVKAVLASPKGFIFPMAMLSAGMVDDNDAIGFIQLANDDVRLFY